MTGLDKGLGTVQEIEISIAETRAEVGIGDTGPELFQEIEKVDQDQNPDLESSSHVSTNRDRLRCYRCSEYDHFVREMSQCFDR